MSQYTRRLGAAALIAVTMLVACKSGSDKADSASLAADSTLNKDLTLAGADTAAQPQLKDVATQSGATAKPAAPKPKAAPTTSTTKSGNTVTKNSTPSTSGGKVGEIAAGTELSSTANAKVCTNTNAVGDKVTATIANAVSGTNGVQIPAGATLNLTVTQLKRSENVKDAVVMEFAVNSVTFDGHTFPIDGAISSATIEKVRDEPTSKDVQKVAIGAVAGAIAGKLIGKSTKGAVIGGAAGAAAGAATAAATGNYQGCINSGSTIVVKLNSAATIKA